MKRLLLPLVATLGVACNAHQYHYPEPPQIYCPPENFPTYPSFPYDPPPQHVPYATTAAAPATNFPGVVKTDDIALKIQGVNLALLQDALKTAAERSNFVVEEGTPQPTEPDQVRIRLSPVTIGGYNYSHEILAKVRSQAREVALIVSSQAYRDEAGVRKYYIAPDEVPRQVFQSIESKLKGK